MKNVMYNTTRQWNCGDEFILLGCINIINAVIGEHNKIIYNRNPDIRPANGEDVYYRNIKLPLFYEKLSISKLGAKYRFGFHDNSIKYNSDMSYIDYAVFAGSPEWKNSRCKNFYTHILKNDIPAIFLGIGSASKRLPKYIDEVVQKSIFLSFRDNSFAQSDKKKYQKALYIPCPALLSVPLGLEKDIKNVQTIGLVFQANYKNSVKNQVLNDNTYNLQVKLYKNIIKKYSNKDIKIICHYIDEIELAYKIFGENTDVIYSYDSKDYIELYRKCDLVISPRVHGCGISSSLGIPSFIIKHDNRGNTADGFLAETIDLNSNFDKISKQIDEAIANAKNKNEQLKQHKKEVLETYIEKLSTAIKNPEIKYDKKYKTNSYGKEENLNIYFEVKLKHTLVRLLSVFARDKLKKKLQNTSEMYGKELNYGDRYNDKQIVG